VNNYKIDIDSTEPRGGTMISSFEKKASLSKDLDLSLILLGGGVLLKSIVQTDDGPPMQ